MTSVYSSKNSVITFDAKFNICSAIKGRNIFLRNALQNYCFLIFYQFFVFLPLGMIFLNFQMQCNVWQQNNSIIIEEKKKTPNNLNFSVFSPSVATTHAEMWSLDLLLMHAVALHLLTHSSDAFRFYLERHLMMARPTCSQIHIKKSSSETTTLQFVLFCNIRHAWLINSKCISENF